MHGRVAILVRVVPKSSDGRVAILLLTVLYQGLKTSTVVQDCLPCERAQDQDRDISVIATLSVLHIRH